MQMKPIILKAIELNSERIQILSAKKEMVKLHNADNYEKMLLT